MQKFNKSNQEITAIVNEAILKYVGFTDLFNSTMNESFLEEFFKDPEVQEIQTKLKQLIIELSRRGCQKAIKSLVWVAKKGVKEGKNPSEVSKNPFYGLAFLTIGFTTNFIKSCNEHPVIPNTHFEQQGDSLIISEDSGKQVKIQKNKETGLPEFVEPTNINKEDTLSTSIRALQKGEKAPTYYKGSDELKNLIAKNMEGLSLEIYSTVKGHPKPKSKKDMLHMKDLTIGYGHKLTKEERRTWKWNKKLTKEEAWQLFLKDYKIHEEAANELLRKIPFYNKVEFGQGFVDGIISIRYNSSEELITSSQFWASLSACRIGKKEIDQSDFDVLLKPIKTLWKATGVSNGLRKRRLREYQMMRQPFGQKLNIKLYTEPVY